MKKTVPRIVALLLLISALAPSIQVKADEPSHWILEERGDNYSISYNSTHPSLKRWNSEPLWVLNSSGGYAPYVLTDRYLSEGYYDIRTGLIRARIFDYYAMFIGELGEVRVYDERWEVQEWTGNKWSDIGAQSGIPTLRVSEGKDCVNITKTFNSWAGELTIIYIFRGGQPLKHTVYFNSSIAEETQFRLIQIWAGIVGDQVIHEYGVDTISTATELNGTFFRFLKNDGSLSVFENQWAAIEYLDPVYIDTHAQGMKADFIFSNWTLAQNERLEIDPDTATLDNPTIDGHIDDGYEQIIDWEDRFMFGRYQSTSARYTRGFIEWPISSIPDGSTITDTILKYHGKTNGPDDSRIVEMTDCRPSISDYDTLLSHIEAGDSYVNPWNPIVATGQEQDLGPTADSDLQDKLVVDWFAIGFSATFASLNGFDDIYSQEYTSADPKPTLYVEYTANVAPNQPTFNSPVNNSKVEPSENVNVSWTFSDPDDGDYQGAYRFQLSNSSDFSTTLNDSTKVASSNEYYIVDFPEQLAVYYVRVKTWDDSDMEGPWSSTLFVEVAPAESAGGWSPSGSIPADSTPLASDDGAITPASPFLNLGIVLIVGSVVFALFWKEIDKKDDKPLKKFQSRRDGKQRTSKEKEKQVPKKFKNRRK